MTPSREAIEAAAQELARQRGFVWVDDPIERGQDAYDMCVVALSDAEAALTAAYARDFPQPPPSPYDALYRDIRRRVEPKLQTLKEAVKISNKRAAAAIRKGK